MREQVFADASARQDLEGILHPLIGSQARAEGLRAPQACVTLVVPRLLEQRRLS